MQAFRDGKVRCLVATDVVGRGIDVSGVSHIINYDIPQFSDDYVHRVGRTGRMGREGIAFTFVTPEEGNELTRIEIRIERLLERDEIEGFEAFTRKAAPQGLPVELLGPGGETGNGPRSEQPGGDSRVEEPEAPKPKPAPFGSRTRRIRRAL
jgi:ATP-dependent RNA helicase DeaD